MASIPLTRGFYAIVDDDDYEHLSQWKWTYNFVPNGTGYAYRHKTVDRKIMHISMHRYIMNEPKGMEVDHINSDGLDNRRCNLRVCTKQENSWNKKPLPSRTGYKGIHQARYRWTMEIIHNAIKHRVCGWSTPEDAARAYDAYATYYFGKYAWRNFQDEETNILWLL